MIPIKEAKSIVEKHLFEVEKEQVLLKNAGDRILAQDVVASFRHHGLITLPWMDLQYDLLIQ